MTSKITQIHTSTPYITVMSSNISDTFKIYLPKENWFLLLQNILSRKAHAIFTKMYVYESSYYETVKGIRKERNEQTYMDFAR